MSLFRELSISETSVFAKASGATSREKNNATGKRLLRKVFIYASYGVKKEILFKVSVSVHRLSVVLLTVVGYSMLVLHWYFIMHIFEKNYQKLAINTNRIKEIMEKLISDLRNFAKERNWIRYHSPKNLAMALSVETAELVEIFQWLETADSLQVDTTTRKHIAEEVGDVMIYLSMLADKFDLDPLTCAKDKMKLNAVKYPADK